MEQATSAVVYVVVVKLPALLLPVGREVVQVHLYRPTVLFLQMIGVHASSVLCRFVSTLVLPL